MSVGVLVPARVEHLALAIGALCMLIAWFAPLAEYQNFLLLIGSVFAPLFGVVLVDHFLLRRRGLLPAPRAALRWETLLAWACGAITYHVLASAWPQIGASLPALFLSGGLLLLLSRFGRVTAGTPVSE